MTWYWHNNPTPQRSVPWLGCLPYHWNPAFGVDLDTTVQTMVTPYFKQRTMSIRCRHSHADQSERMASDPWPKGAILKAPTISLHVEMLVTAKRAAAGPTFSAYWVSDRLRTCGRRHFNDQRLRRLCSAQSTLNVCGKRGSLTVLFPTVPGGHLSSCIFRRAGVSSGVIWNCAGRRVMLVGERLERWMKTRKEACNSWRQWDGACYTREELLRFSKPILMSWKTLTRHKLLFGQPFTWQK